MDNPNEGRIYVVKGSSPSQIAVNNAKIANHKNPGVANSRYEVNVEAKTAKMLSIEAIAKAKLAKDEIDEENAKRNVTAAKADAHAAAYF